MAEKVKLTKEQADAIEEYRKEHGDRFLMNAHSLRRWTRGMRPCNGLDNDEMARALYVGYEVEPKFKIWDYVTRIDDGQIIEVMGINRSNKYLYEHSDNIHYFKDVRHSTVEEIAEEKQRRWWKKHGREPWELKVYDILVDEKGNTHQVTKAMGTIDIEFVHIPLYAIKKHYEVACFAEDRKDIEQ